MLRNLKIYGVAMLLVAILVCAANASKIEKSFKNSGHKEPNKSAPQLQAYICPFKKQCIDECATPRSRNNEYLPFCGTDGETYRNYSYLKCFKKCNVNISVAYDGPCKDKFLEPKRVDDYGSEA